MKKKMLSNKSHWLQKAGRPKGKSNPHLDNSNPRKTVVSRKS